MKRRSGENPPASDDTLLLLDVDGEMFGAISGRVNKEVDSSSCGENIKQTHSGVEDPLNSPAFGSSSAEVRKHVHVWLC